MSGRRARAARRVVPPRPDVTVRVGQLLNVALALPADVPVGLPLRVVADDMARSLTPLEAADSLVKLAMVARLFALAVPAERRDEMHGGIERAFVGHALDQREWEFVERKESIQ